MEQPMIYGKMIEAMQKVGAIDKSRRNETQKFMFRGIDDVMNALHNVFAEVGIFCVPVETRTTQVDRTSKSGGVLICTSMQVKYRFYATDGSYVDAMMDGEAMDSGDKSTSKAASIAFKYLLFETFMIPTEEKKDPDFDTHEVVAPAPTQAPKQIDSRIELIPGTDIYKKAVTYLATGGGTMEAIVKKYKVAQPVAERLQADALEIINPK